MRAGGGGPIDLIFTKHARQRMEERNVKQSTVISVVSNPHVTYTDTDGNLSLVRDGVRVVLTPDRKVVITVVRNWI